ncbi:MAG TPA: hypothetical protein DCF63_14260, partial [Planctomycetaceae bacterium]|nr:hypothetical protein [Planctomycetaceae bacterium]
RWELLVACGRMQGSEDQDNTGAVAHDSVGFAARRPSLSMTTRFESSDKQVLALRFALLIAFFSLMRNLLVSG